ncbi:hypothetical protein B0H21DRAFT_752338 [Amylocystis lapponica]|nr:hypothetical protein B0H21DRAFT_752338 [Amylocystis lapponica]
MSHKLAEPYSGKNPVPKIATKITSLVNPQRATDAKARQLQNRSDKRGEKDIKKTARSLAKGNTMHVTEPATGEEVDIRNAAEEPDLNSKGENVLRRDFPPPDLVRHREQVLSVTTTNVKYISAAYILSAILSSTLCTSFVAGCLFLLPPTILAYCLLFHIHRTSEGDFEDRAWHAERMRGMRAGSDVDEDGQISDEERTRESAEWANALLRGVWPIVNPDIFASVVDMIEDIMQSSVPSFVHSVRIVDMGLGSNAARITAIRSLPDASEPEPGVGASDNIGESMKVDSKPIDNDSREALDADHVNLEVSFAYRGLPSGQSAVSKARNIHLLVEFFPGMRGVFGFKFPVWVEITGAVGTARVRLQLISNPPFVKTTLLTLMGLPHITISAVPLSEKLPNVMNLPFISGFISSAINTAAAEYVAPKSLTIDLQKLISGDDIKKDTDAIGVFVVHIHRATGVKSMDTGGGSADPYVTLTYSRLGRPLYSTRIIKGDCNPVFEETAVLMVDVNTLNLREKLSFQLWDSDRMSADDMLGFHDVDLVELIRQRSQAVRRVSPLSSPDSRTRPGCVEYTIGYYGKRAPSAALATDGADPGIPDDLRAAPEFQQARAVALNDLEAAVLTTPPDAEWPSGLLSVQVHEIRELVVRATGREKTELGERDREEEQEEAEGLPSSYCMISLNDELVYQTRVKPITSSPMFNAGTERFVRDWRKAHITVIVKDSRMRENDAVLGVVFLKLSELFVNASQVTRFYSLQEGIGHGRIRISLLFRPVEAKLPPNLLGFDTGTIELRDIAVRSTQDLSKSEIRLKTTTSPAEEKVSRRKAEARDDGTVVWSDDSTTAIPVRQRYGAALLVSFKDAPGFKSAGRKALAVLWLRDLVDLAEGPVEVALWHARHGDYSRLKMNYVPADGDLASWDSDREKVERIGTVRLDVVFRPGISRRHHEMLGGAGAKKRSAWDEYDREQAAGMRDAVGKMDVQVPGQRRARASCETGEEEGHGEEEDIQTDRTMTGGPLNSAAGDADAADENAREGGNTVVSTEDVEDRVSAVEHSDALGEDDTEGSGTEDGGLVGKLKGWRQHEKELHRDHRGVMQSKPARTAQWMKDNVEGGVHAITSGFKMKARQPDVETET